MLLGQCTAVHAYHIPIVIFLKVDQTKYFNTKIAFYHKTTYCTPHNFFFLQRLLRGPRPLELYMYIIYEYICTQTSCGQFLNNLERSMQVQNKRWCKTSQFQRAHGPWSGNTMSKKGKRDKGKCRHCLWLFCVCVQATSQLFKYFLLVCGQIYKKTYKNEILKNWKVFRSHSHPKETKKDNF